MNTHQQIVEALCLKHGAKTLGFNAAVADLLAGEVPRDDRADERKHVLEFMRANNVVPDCYRVVHRLCAEGRVPAVCVWEVVITNPPSSAKLAAYQAIASFFDNEGAQFTVYQVDPYSHETRILDEESWASALGAG